MLTLIPQKKKLRVPVPDNNNCTFSKCNTLLSTAGSGLKDVVEKTSIIFVAITLKSATNCLVAEKEEDIMRHLIRLFAPPRGIPLELGNLQIQRTHVHLELFYIHFISLI